MAVILKKDEKVKEVLSVLATNYTNIDFIFKFKEMYPLDWTKVIKNYEIQRSNTKPSKPIPMPKPEQYLINALNVWIKKNKRNEFKIDKSQ